MSENIFLKQVFSDRRFTKQELEEIITQFKKVSFQKHDLLQAEGKKASRYFFLETGFARSFVVDLSGNDISTKFYQPGDIVIDWTSFFTSAPAEENVQAITKCDCWELGFEMFQELFNKMESFRESGRARLVASYFELKQHSLSMITSSAKDRYQKLVTESPNLIQNISLKQIATYLGITDTSLSRIRKELTP